MRLRQPDKMGQAQTRGTSCVSADVLLSSSPSPSPPPHTQSAPAALLLTRPRRALPQGLCMHWTLLFIRAVLFLCAHVTPPTLVVFP